MPLSKIPFAPGIDRESSQYATGPSWYDCDKIRFRKGRPEQIGGWVLPSATVVFPVGNANGETTTSFRGVCRSLLDWGTAGSTKYLGIGTNVKFYVELGGAISDITPLRSTTAAGDVTFAAVNGSSTLTVTDASHGASVGDYVTFSGAVSLGGLIVAGVLNNEYEILTVTAGAYTITARDIGQTIVTANASDTGNGGASVVGKYQLATGTNNFVPATGYSVSTYGANPYGGGGALTLANQLRQYSQDIFGDDLIFNPRGGSVFYWDEGNGVGVRAVDISTLSGASNTPTTALQVMVSPVDRHVICFGVDPITNPGVIDPLLVRWSDQEHAANWTPTAINTAGGQVLSSGTQIVGAVRTRQEILIFTDTSIHAMRFSGAPFVFQFSVIAENVTSVSPRGMISSGDMVFFMDLEGFYVYQGSVQKLSCSVSEYVFSNIDRGQLHKVFATNNPDDNEVTWFYPATGAADVSRYVTYNYMEQVWTIGSMVRGAWIQAPSKTYPVATSNDTVDVKNNYLYEHETGYDAAGSTMGAYIESGGVELGDGDSLMFLRRIIPDFRTAGVDNNVDFTVTIKGRDYPQDDFATSGAQYSTSSVLATTKQSHVRVRAREIVLRIASQNTGYGWTMGDFRLDLRSDGKRG